MPSIKPNSKVLVTGANGFIAAHCIKSLLAADYRVRGTLRNLEKAQDIFAVHSRNGGLGSPTSQCPLDFVEVSDLCSEEQWIAALQDCDAVVHLASTFRYDVPPTAFEAELLRPAVQGTVSLLSAAAKVKSVRRVSIMSSFAAIYDAALGPLPGKLYSEDDWCPITWEEGVKTTAVPVAYRASKALAEKSAWKFMAVAKPDFDLVSLCPGMVFGPMLQSPKELKDLNASNQIIWEVISGESREMPPTKAPVFTDVSDLAESVVRSLTKAEASGQRYLIASGVYCTQEIADIVREALPRYANNVPLGEPGKRYNTTHYGIDNSKAIRELGMDFAPLEASVVPLASQLFEVLAATPAS